MTRGYRNNKTVCLLVSFFFVFFFNHYWILCEKPGGIKNHFGACVCVLRVCMCVYLYFFFSEWNRGWQDVIFLCPVCMYFLLVRPLATMKQTTDSFFRKKKDQRVPLQVSGMVLVRHFLLKNAFQQKWLIQLRLLYDIIEQDCHVLLYCSQCGPTFPLKWKFANKYET